MSEFIQNMAEAIGAFFTGYFASIDDIIALAGSTPWSTRGGVSFPASTLWAAAQNFQQNVVVGVASALVSLFLFFELVELMTRSNIRGLDGLQCILMAFLKMAISLAVIKNMDVIIGACFQITNLLAQQTGALLNSGTSIGGEEIASAITDYYNGEDISFWTKLGAFLTAFLISLVNNVAFTLVKIICQLRFVEIYIFMAVAPIPFSTFVSQEYKQMGVNFVKRMFALGLQGVFICIICYFYAVIVNQTVGSITIGDGAISPMFTMLGYSLLLVIAAFQTGGWSKQLLQCN
ncbi:MAG: type IV secretion system protein [Firmicutes bacterium]|nr:type IV secretion system protein [Bacillota bacterium]